MLLQHKLTDLPRVQDLTFQNYWRGVRRMIPTWFGIAAVIQIQPFCSLQKINNLLFFKSTGYVVEAANPQTPMTTDSNIQLLARQKSWQWEQRAPLKPHRLRRAFNTEGVSDSSWNAFWSHLEWRLQSAVFGGLPHCAPGCHTKAAILLLQLTFCSICWLKENQTKKLGGQNGILNIPKSPHSPFWKRGTKD